MTFTILLTNTVSSLEVVVIHVSFYNIKLFLLHNCYMYVPPAFDCMLYTCLGRLYYYNFTTHQVLRQKYVWAIWWVLVFIKTLAYVDIQYIYIYIYKYIYMHIISSEHTKKHLTDFIGAGIQRPEPFSHYSQTSQYCFIAVRTNHHYCRS